MEGKVRKHKPPGSKPGRGGHSVIDHEQAFPLMLEEGRYSRIGEMFGVTKMAAWTEMNKSEIKDKFEDFLKIYLGKTLPKALTDSVALIDIDPAQCSMPLLRLKYEEVDKVLKTAGLRPSESTPVFIQKLQQINVFENPLVKEVLGQFQKNMVEWKPEGVVDVEEAEAQS